MYNYLEESASNGICRSIAHRSPGNPRTQNNCGSTIVDPQEIMKLLSSDSLFLLHLVSKELSRFLDVIANLRHVRSAEFLDH